jgi:hypothetical protein
LFLPESLFQVLEVNALNTWNNLKGVQLAFLILLQGGLRKFTGKTGADLGGIDNSMPLRNQGFKKSVTDYL